MFEAVSLRRVPYIGHNCYMDLIFLQNAFNGGLPAEYTREIDSDCSSGGFKESIKKFLGCVFDSKTIANA